MCLIKHMMYGVLEVKLHASLALVLDVAERLAALPRVFYQTNYMGQSPSWEDNSHSSNQRITRLSCN
jgi:hypothetical protein